MSIASFVPSKATLRKYGLTVTDWKLIFLAQDEACAVCARKPPKVKLCIDHEHVKGWKKMDAKQRRGYVRGLVCIRCNWKFLTRGMTLNIANNMSNYLKKYEYFGCL